MELLRNVKRYVSRGLMVAAWVGLVASVTVAFEEVISRYVFGVSHPWASELCVFTVLYAVCLSIAIAHERRAHILVDFVLSRLPELWRKILVLAADLIVLVVCIVLIKATIDATVVAHGALVRTVSQSYVTWPLVLALPIGFTFYAIYCLIGILEACLSLSSRRVTASGKEDH